VTGPVLAKKRGVCFIKSVKVAVVHDWLQFYGGAERVLNQVLELFPGADLFCLLDFMAPEQRGFLAGKTINTSFIQKLPLARTRYRTYLPLMPLAVEQFDLSGYDVVISSSHAVAKGVLTGPGQLHLCICYTPLRYAWEKQHQYLKQAGLERGIKSWFARALLHRLRNWDYRTANGVDAFIAISKHIAGRIWKTYRREAEVIYPPVDTAGFTPAESSNSQAAGFKDYYLTVSRLVPYKRVDLIVEAFSARPEKQLVVIGEGPEMKKIRKKAGANVTLLGYQPFPVVREYLQQAKGFIFAAEEDFGIAPLEAQACGTPVIAYGRGGALETIIGEKRSGRTGVFFYRQEIDSLLAALDEFEQVAFLISAENCRNNALRFSPDLFRQQFKDFVNGWLDSSFNSKTGNYEVVALPSGECNCKLH